MSITAVPIPPTRRAILVALWLGLAVLAAAGLWLAFQGTAGAVAEQGSNEQFLAFNKTRPGVIETASGLQYQVLSKGEGDAHPTDTDVSLIQYTGKLRDGTVFDASKQPTPLPVAGSVPGFSEGLKLMTKKAKYRLWLKPELAYGANSPDPSKIPNDSLLIFDVELLDFLPESVIQQMQQQQMMQQQMQQGGAGAPPPPGAAPGR